MKKVILAIVAVMAITGCNHNDVETVEIGEPIEVSEQIVVACDEAVVVTLNATDEVNVTTEANGTTEVYDSEYGANVKLTVVSPCVEPVECPDCNDTCGEPVVCDDPVICGEGTFLDEATNTCSVIEEEIPEEDDGLDISPIGVVEPTLTCDRAFLLVDKMCMPKRYTPTLTDGEYADCLDTYEWKEDRELCVIIRNFTI